MASCNNSIDTKVVSNDSDIRTKSFRNVYENSPQYFTVDVNRFDLEENKKSYNVIKHKYLDLEYPAITKRAKAWAIFLAIDRITYIEYLENKYKLGNQHEFLWTELLQTTRREIMQDSTNVDLYSYSGEIKFHLKDYVSSVEDYEKAISLDPTNGYLYLNEGYSLDWLDKKDEACSKMRKARDLGSSVPNSVIESICNH